MDKQDSQPSNEMYNRVIVALERLAQAEERRSQGEANVSNATMSPDMQQAVTTQEAKTPELPTAKKPKKKKKQGKLGKFISTQSKNWGKKSEGLWGFFNKIKDTWLTKGSVGIQETLDKPAEATKDWAQQMAKAGYSPTEAEKATIFRQFSAGGQKVWKDKQSSEIQFAGAGTLLGDAERSYLGSTYWNKAWHHGTQWWDDRWQRFSVKVFFDEQAEAERRAHNDITQSWKTEGR